MLDGLTEAMGPDGPMLRESPTDPWNPFTLSTRTIAVLDEPIGALSDPGSTLTVKSWTMTIT